MKKFVAIYGAPIAEMDKMMKDTSKEQMEEWNKSWKAWVDAHQASFVDMGAPLGKNKRVTKDGVTDTRNELNGFSVVQAESHEEAVKIFTDNPQLQMPGAYIDVLNWVDMKM